MRKSRRIISLLFTLALAFATMVFPASAADTTEFDNSNPLTAALLASDDCVVRYAKGGTVRIIVATLSNDEIPAIMTLASNPNPHREEGTAYWNDPSVVSFQCRDGWGTECTIRVYNEDTENNLKVQYDYEINGEPLSIQMTAVKGDSVFTTVESPDSDDLTCYIETTMTPARGTTGLSADWSYFGNQY